MLEQLSGVGVMDQAALAAISSWIVHKLRGASSVPQVGKDTPVATRSVSALLALASSVGLSYTYDSASGDLLIKGLTVGNVLAFGWSWVKQYIAQELLWRAAGKPAPAA